MKSIRTVEDVKQLGAVLSVWAHPNDEAFYCGAILAAAAMNNQRVICVTATKGELGAQDTDKWKSEQLAQIRQQEREAALGELGVAEHHWFDYRDGACDQVSEEEAARRITSLIEKCNVDSVLTFGPEGLTGNSDHQTVSRWVDAAVYTSERRPTIYHAVQPKHSYEKHLKKADVRLGIFFEIEEPPLVDAEDCDICLHPAADTIERKYRALRAMPTQTDAILRAITPENFVGAFGTETLVRAADLFDETFQA